MAGHAHTLVVCHRRLEQMFPPFPVPGGVPVEQHPAVPPPGMGLLQPVGQLGGLAQSSLEVLLRLNPSLPRSGGDARRPQNQPAVVTGGQETRVRSNTSTTEGRGQRRVPAHPER